METRPVRQCMLEINLGPYLQEISNVFTVNRGSYENSFCYYDGSQYRQYLVYVNCSEDNPYFYSLDGRLYNKSDDTLVTDFAYWADKDKYKVNGQ